ncbi:MAG: DUF1588 domain-containing protein [Phycisphaeraceae bacterium]
MKRHLLIFAGLVAVVGVGLFNQRAESAEALKAVPQAQGDTLPGTHRFKNEMRPLLQKYCAHCHTGEKAKAKYRVDDISGNIAAGDDTVRWEKALEMVGLGDMPPEKADQPADAERKKLTDWIAAELKKIGRGRLDEAMLHPAHANRVPHDKLFSGEHKGPASSPPRLWRLSPQAYSELLSFDGSDATLERIGGHGFQDYASLKADEAVVNVMLQTTDLVASFMVGEQVKLTRKSPHGGHKSRLEHRPDGALIKFYENKQPTEEDYADVVVAGYRKVFEREPDEAQAQRFLNLLVATSNNTDHRIGVKTMLRAMMMSPEFIFRMELGLGEQLPDGRRMLSPMELAYAIGFAIMDTGPDHDLLKAAEEGRLATRADVEREVRRLLAAEEDPRNRLYQMDHKWYGFKPKKARLLRFFREYFGYYAAPDVFKDDSRAVGHRPLYLVRDADQLVLYALEHDRQVLQFLLTTDRYFVSYYGDPKEYNKWLEKVFAPQSERDRRHVESLRGRGVTLPSRQRTNHLPAYNLPVHEWNYEPIQPFKQPVPRAGMLTHPAWLVAHSGNFDNDIVRRGKWIREHLLAGVVPELPIGVDAQLTTDTTLTLREKFKLKVYNDECWRCHKKMNPLGYPFEMYDDFGQFRTEHHYDQDGNVVPSPRELENLHRKIDRDHEQGRETDVLLTARLVNTAGHLDGTGDPELDGEVTDAIDLMHRLAKSEIARQSFIRHAFRYWMGRNETLDDSPTLIAADKAYQESDGSFNELLVSLLTSDSFLYRK